MTNLIVAVYARDVIMIAVKFFTQKQKNANESRKFYGQTRQPPNELECFVVIFSF